MPDVFSFWMSTVRSIVEVEPNLSMKGFKVLVPNL